MLAVPARYREVANDIRRRLAEGEWDVGSHIPGIGMLMNQYNVPSLNTVRQAERVLIDEGLLVPEAGRGVRVVALPRSDASPERAAELIASIRRDLLELEKLLTT
jgi:DNA-binding GntR family transcriptional regulator